MNHVDASRDALVRAASELFTTRSFAEISIADIAAEAAVPSEVALRAFPSTHDIGTVVLDHERASMHAVQDRLASHDGSALDRLVLAFRLVGENLAGDVLVRAGVCLASGARHAFPARRLDPFQTWLTFVDGLLTTARADGELRNDVDLTSAGWLVVASGMGTMDCCRTQGRWHDATRLLEQTALGMVALLRAPAAEGRR